MTVKKKFSFYASASVMEFLDSLSKKTGYSKNEILSLGLLCLGRYIDEIDSLELFCLEKLKDRKVVVVEVNKKYPVEFIQFILDTNEKHGQLEKLFARWQKHPSENKV